MTDLVLPVAQALLDCLCSNFALSSTPPANCCYRIGTEVGQDADLFSDLCCEGLAYVLLGDIYPSTDSFPDEDIIRQARTSCGVASWAVELRAGIMRCAPVGDAQQMPTCTDWNAAALINIEDAMLLRRTTCCFVAAIRSNANLLGMSVIIRRQTQGPVAGGCVDRAVTLQVQIPNCDC